jgi:hypothetical protein
MIQFLQKHVSLLLHQLFTLIVSLVSISILKNDYAPENILSEGEEFS